MPEPSVFSSGFLVFRNRGGLQFLLMQHAHRWDLPKGHLDAGESRQQAALRELTEETGLGISDIWIDPEFRYTDHYWVQYPNRGGQRKWKELTLYLAFMLVDREIVATEHLGSKWFDWSPPHRIQGETIDPLLAQVESYLVSRIPWPPHGVSET
jgi:8-oxo-dGTP pyrophosphatase MutT (NUDIX family)